jgi:hypothetical protein
MLIYGELGTVIAPAPAPVASTAGPAPAASEPARPQPFEAISVSKFGFDKGGGASRSSG